MTRIFTLTTAALMTATTAFAGEINLHAEMEAASLHEAGVDMVVYYMDAESHYHIVATYVSPTDKEAPLRMEMGLTDGDRVTFALPEHPETNYTFARTGTTVNVNATPTGPVVAQK